MKCYVVLISMIDVNYYSRVIILIFGPRPWYVVICFIVFSISLSSMRLFLTSHFHFRIWDHACLKFQCRYPNKMSISFFHLTLCTALSSLISDYYFRYDLYFFLSNLLSRGINYTYLTQGNLISMYDILQYEYLFSFLSSYIEIFSTSYYQGLHVYFEVATILDIQKRRL